MQPALQGAATITQVSHSLVVSDMGITLHRARTVSAHAHSSLGGRGITCTRGSPTTDPGPSGSRRESRGRGSWVSALWKNLPKSVDGGV